MPSIIKIMTLLCASCIFSAAHASCISPVQTERLSNYCLLEKAKGTSISLQTGKLIDYRLKKEGYAQGLGLPGRVRSVTLQTDIAPVLEYEDNINGGNPNKPLILGPYEFNGDPALVRKHGVVFGLNASLNGRYTLGAGRYIDYFGGISHSYSPKYNIWIRRHNAYVCTKNHIKNLWHVDACAKTSHEKKQLVESRQNTLSFSTSKLYKSSGHNFHQISFGVSRIYKVGYTQNQFNVKRQTIHSNGWHSSLQTVFGARVENQLATLASLTGVVSIPVNKKNITVSAGYSNAHGGRLLGIERTENTWSLSTAFNIHKNILLRVGYEATTSTISYFNKSSLTFSVIFAPLDFSY